MTAIYLVGPSQVGKTMVSRRLAEEFGFEHRDLDGLLTARASGCGLIHVAQDWSIVAPLLEDAERSEQGRVVVDIGAGTQDMDRRHQQPRLEVWLGARRSRVILLRGSPDEIYVRTRAHHGNRAGFDMLEFGPARQRIYATASTTINLSGLSRDASVKRACCAILELVRHLNRPS